MKKLPSILGLTGLSLILCNCAGIPGESPDHMRKRIERQDKLINQHEEKRKIRNEASDRRYDQWWDNATGHKDTDW